MLEEYTANRQPPVAAVGPVSEEKSELEVVVQQAVASPWIEHLTRFGYIIRGLLYGEVGLLAVQVALGIGGDTTDTQGAIANLSRYSLGAFLLVLIAVGLAGYSLWGVIRAVLDPLGRGSGIKGLAERGGYIVSAISYAALLVPTVQIIFGARSDEFEEGPLDFTAGLLSLDGGPWLLAIVGLIVIGGGLGEWYRAISAGFKKDFKAIEMSEGELNFAVAAGRFGHAARGVVFMMIGYFLLKAGFLDQAYQARGLDGALETLARQSYGPYLLGAVALGLLTFGVFSALSARWMRVTKAPKRGSRQS